MYCISFIVTPRRDFCCCLSRFYNHSKNSVWVFGNAGLLGDKWVNCVGICFPALNKKKHKCSIIKHARTAGAALGGHTKFEIRKNPFESSSSEQICYCLFTKRQLAQSPGTTNTPRASVVSRWNGFLNKNIIQILHRGERFQCQTSLRVVRMDCKWISRRT